MMLPFSAVVGQDVAKTALLLAATRPTLGGVLLRGDKGSAKTTLARGLAALLPAQAPFVELPLGAGEDRVLGSLDLNALLTTGTAAFRPGLLAAAHGGVLYVDEINLLPDHLVDVLLDVAVSGVNRVERDGLSHTHPARFVLVGSMNLEEGDLRPQLLDRFGLAVDVCAPTDPQLRAEIVRAQMMADRAVDSPPDAGDDALRAQLERARGIDAELPDAIIEMATHLALEVGAEGLRADLMLCRAAVAHAALHGRTTATTDDLAAVAGAVLTHRRRRRPFDPPALPQDELDRAWSAADDRMRQSRPPEQRPADDNTTTDSTATNDNTASDDTTTDGAGPAPDDRFTAPGDSRSLHLAPARKPSSTGAAGSGATALADRGRIIRTTPLEGTSQRPDGTATATALAVRRATNAEPGAPATQDDLRSTTRTAPVGTLMIFVVDASGSMGAHQRMAATKAAVIGLLGDAYIRRDRVALITCGGEHATVVLRPTASVEIARTRLHDLSTGGMTPLASGLDEARRLIEGSAGDRTMHATVIAVTDGRATVGGDDPVQESHRAAAELARTGARIVVIDTETGHTRLGLAQRLADAAGGECVRLDADGDPAAPSYTSGSLERTVRRFT